MDYLLIFLGVMIFLFAVGVPVAISIGLTCLVVLVVQGGIEKIPEELFAMQMLSGLNNFPIIAVPFFILAASLMNTGGGLTEGNNIYIILLSHHNAAGPRMSGF